MSHAVPLISVVIPIYKQEKYLPLALDSIFSQTHRNLEIIVIVDGPSSEIHAIEKLYPTVIFYHQPNSGISVARNKGIELAKGEFISFLDADDWLEKDKLSKQLQYFEDDSKLECCLCSIRNFLDEDSDSTDWFPKEELGILQIYVPGMLVKAEIFKKFGGFPWDFPSGEDTEWLSSAQNSGLNWSVCRDSVINRRIHGANATRDRSTCTKALIKTLWNSVRNRKAPTVSVVIPAYNPKDFLNDAIQSALDQTLKPSEIVIVDDGSNVSVQSMVTIESPLIRFISISHRGTAACRNIGVRESTSEFIAFFDADDISETARLAVQVESLRRSYDSSISFCALEEFLSPEFYTSEVKVLRSGVATTSGTLLARRSIFEKVGPFNENLRIAYFMDWLKRSRALGFSERQSEKVLVRRRIHDGNTSRLFPSLMKEEYLKVIRSNLPVS